MRALLGVLSVLSAAVAVAADPCNFKGINAVNGSTLWACMDSIPPPTLGNATTIVDSMILSWSTHSFIDIYRQPMPPHTCAWRAGGGAVGGRLKLSSQRARAARRPPLGAPLQRARAQTISSCPGS
jgi:hypothetical protein